MTLHLLASTLIGALYLAILFILCFGAVTGAKLLRRYLAARKKPAPPPPAQRAKRLSWSSATASRTRTTSAR